MALRVPLRVCAEPRLIEDPLAMLAENDLGRRPDALDDSLWTFDMAAALPQPPRPPPIPTIRLHVDAPRCSTQARYTAKFKKSFPDVAGILSRISNVYTAGGAASWPLIQGRGRHVAGAPGDIDIFVVGIPSEDLRALWAKVGEVRAVLHAACSGEWTEVISPGVLTMRNSKRAYKFQIILRAFATVSALLHGFDLASCAIAFDGEVAYMTHAAVWAYVFMLNVVNPAYRSTTYEYRLYKYFYRGYGLGLPGLDPATLAEWSGYSITLPHLVLHVDSCDDDGHAHGSVSLRDTVEEMGSDYSVSVGRAQYALHNIRQVMIGVGRFAYDLGAAQALEDFAAAPPTLDVVLPRRALENALDSAAANVIRTDGTVDAGVLRRIFQIPDCVIHRFRRAVAAAGLAAGAAVAAATAVLLAPYRAALIDAYETAPREIPWWILIDPSRQYTVSLNPRIEDAAKWYGDYVRA